MKRLIIEPNGWPCRFLECTPGLFIWQNELFLKTEYGEIVNNKRKADAYLETGEYFSPNASYGERDDIIVQPVESHWEEYGD